MSILETEPISCPYCGETIEILVDTSVGEQQYIEDCQVCCRPMVVTVNLDGDEFVVSVRSEND